MRGRCCSRPSWSWTGGCGKVAHEDALIVTVEANGADLRVFHDGPGEAAALSNAARLGQQLALLASELGDDRQSAEWISVVFTSEPNYVPPRGPGAKARFTVAVGPDGPLPASSRRTILIVLPHKQVHDYQQRAGARLPRWFGEGHAASIGTRVTQAIDLSAARAERESLAASLWSSTAPLQLAAWSSVRPRREAIMRQVSPEDCAKMEADSTFVPAGTFRFTSGDMIGDESNMTARYAGALAVFENLADRHGSEAVQAWAAEVTGSPRVVMPDYLSNSVRRHFGETLEALLRDH